VYSRSDITFLTKASDAEDAVRNLDLPLSEVLSASSHASQRSEVTTPDALRTCSPSHTLQAIFESFAQVRFNRMYVVDEKDNQTLLGVVSAKDLVQYFLRDE
jgi:CBS domain-containing protein